MKKKVVGLVTAGALICGLAQAQSGAVTAFTDVSVIPMLSDEVLSGQTVLIQGDRITELGGDVAVPAGAMVIDGTGQFLMPGLAEMHGHVPRPDEPAQYTEDVLFLFVANGITTVRGMLGAEGQLELRERANSSSIIAPTLYLAGPSFNGRSINSPEEATTMVRRQKAEGWNLLKILTGLAKDEYDAMARTAHEEGMRFGGHVPADVGLMHALHMGQETFDHVDGYVQYIRSSGLSEEEAIVEALELTLEKGAWIVPTMALWEAINGTIDIEDLRAYDELKYMPPNVVESWFNRVNNQANNPNYNREAALDLIRTRMRVLAALHQGGARMLLGTDAPQLFSVPGFSLHRELTRMVDAGMDPYSILVSGTRNVGEYFANEDIFGTISPGSRADLLLLPNNPLEGVAHLQHLSGVMVRGVWLSREDLDAGLEVIMNRYRSGN
ncbi:MAG: amidohydrolase family protein [Bacteroidota bacterium]|nr:amidohydrolase family protein [Bacteroidota bacterium]